MSHQFACVRLIGVWCTKDASSLSPVNKRELRNLLVSSQITSLCPFNIKILQMTCLSHVSKLPRLWHTTLLKYQTPIFHPLCPQKKRGLLKIRFKSALYCNKRSNPLWLFMTILVRQLGHLGRLYGIWVSNSTVWVLQILQQVSLRAEKQYVPWGLERAGNVGE